MTEKKEKLASTFTLQNFSSTAKLADNEVGKLGSTGTINEKEYNPFEHRHVELPNSDVGSLIHLLKGSLGSGILAMPAAFKNAGLIAGSIGTFLVGFICTHCVHILVNCSHELCVRSKQPMLGFSETAEAAFKYGPVRIRGMATFAKYFVDTALVLTYYSGNCVYVVLIADSIHQVLKYHFPTLDWDPTIVMWILLVPLAILCQIRELKYLVPFSMLANVLMAVSLIITLYYMFRGMQDVSDRDLFTSFSDLPMFFSTALFAMEGIGVVMPVENSMKKPQHFLGCPGVLNIAMSVVVSLYAVIGFFGYLAYGNGILGSITLNLGIEEIPAQIVKLGVALAVFFTYALQMYVPNDIVWKKILSKHIPEKFTNLGQVVLRTAVVTLTVVVAVVVGNLENFIGLVGSVFFSLLGLLIPSVVETVTLWEYDLGRMKWKLWKNICLAVLALIAMGTGSYLNLKAIIENKG